MHNQGANVQFNLTSGEFQKAGTFSPSFPDGAEWSCSSAGNPPERTTPGSPLPTPRRKLSLDALDDSTQSPLRTESIDSAFIEEASLSSLDKENIFSPGIDLPLISKRRPFGSINSDMACSPGTRRQLYARRPKAQKKLSLSLCGNRCPTLLTRPLSLPVDLKASPFLGQINSPLERMSLRSPSTSQSSSSQLSVNSSESDGYGSDVFDSMELAEVNPTIPKTISDLIHAPLAGEFTSAMEVSSCSMDQHHHVLCLLESDQIMRQRRGSIKRSIESNEEQASKRQMPFFHSSDADPFPFPPEKLSPSVLPTQLQSPSDASANMFPASPGEGGVEMIGDHSKAYVLPLIQGSQPDQNSISPDTVVRLIQGEYSDLVDQFTIIDCRYPYEYRNGHIKDSVNIWDKESLLNCFFESPTHPLEGKRQIIIFHCEFSSKRGPNMSRFMRKTDRDRNGMDFPRLFYPELYLLEGGYRAFFVQHPNFCDPSAYLQMKDDRYQEEAKHFSRRSKSWSEGGGRRPTLRPRLATVGSAAHTNK